MKYSKYCEHLSAKCPSSFFRCPYECGHSTLFTQEQLALHVVECPNGFRECENCGIDVSNKEMANNEHNCVTSLKKIV